MKVNSANKFHLKGSIKENEVNNKSGSVPDADPPKSVFFTFQIQSPVPLVSHYASRSQCKDNEINVSAFFKLSNLP